MLVHHIAALWHKHTANGLVEVVMGMTVARSVFTYCHQGVVSVKDGVTLLFDWELSSIDSL